jgi:hypothetical protein
MGKYNNLKREIKKQYYYKNIQDIIDAIYLGKYLKRI